MHFDVLNFPLPMIVPLTEREFNITKEMWNDNFQPDPESEQGFEGENRKLYEVWNSTVYLTTHIFWEENGIKWNKILIMLL
jgi:hypothetical protein